MHIFYKKAFTALSEAHDASKGSYKRFYKSGLMIEIFADYFAEFCFHSYKDSKFEFTEEEFARYFDILRINDKTVKATDFAKDLCYNICLMYSDGNKYHFTHCSFQEYFCAVFFSKQKDKFIERLGDFFESRKRRMFGDKTFNMLYDMIPDKIEANVFIPFLQELFDKCDEKHGYWTFLETVYPCIQYSKGDVLDYCGTSSDSFLFNFIVKIIKPDYTVFYDELPGSEEFVCTEYGYICTEESIKELVDIETIPEEYPWVQEKPEVVGWIYEISTVEIRNTLRYGYLRDALDDDEFILKSEYNAARAYLDKIKAKQQGDDDFFEGLL